MIPYFQLTMISLGPVGIQVWGLAVATGMLVALLVARRLAVRAGLDGELFLDLALWILVPALVFARLGYVAFYDNNGVISDPWSLFRVWEGGMSSLGGYIGATIGVLAFVRRRRFNLRPYAELAAFVLPLGYGIGRIGCFLIHDHPGVLSTCFLAVAFPDGSRLDHGMLLSLFGFALFAVFLVLRHRGWPVGSDRWKYVPTLLISYGACRLVLDFFRAWDLSYSDTRFLYLTPAQYGAVILIVLGLWLVRKQRGASNQNQNITTV